MKEKFLPYKIFSEWLLNPFPNAELSETVIKALNPKSVLCMFGKMEGITIFLDYYFNKFDIIALKPIEFYSFLKELVQKYKFKKYDFSYFPAMIRDKTLNELQMKLPHLKKHEISHLLDICKGDNESDSFLENLGIKPTPKINKVKNKKNNNLTTLTFNDSILKDICTMDDWKRCFTS